MVLIFFVICAVFFGEVAEWSKAHAWKACIRSESVSRVRIPLSPQFFFLLRIYTEKHKHGQDY